SCRSGSLIVLTGPTLTEYDCCTKEQNRNPSQIPRMDLTIFPIAATHSAPLADARGSEAVRSGSGGLLIRYRPSELASLLKIQFEICGNAAAINGFSA